LLGLTPQGWLRTWDGNGLVKPGIWPEAHEMLTKVGAAVLSIDDVGGEEERIEGMSTACQVLAVTEGPSGSRLYWNGDLRRFSAPEMDEVDATGAGDIYAAAFFLAVVYYKDPWASRPVRHQPGFKFSKRRGLEGIPTQKEIKACLVEFYSGRVYTWSTKKVVWERHYCYQSRCLLAFVRPARPDSGH